MSLLILTLVFPFAEAVAQKPTPTPERDRRVVALINDARLAAPELTVDTLLKLVESKKVTDPVWRKEIIDEALRTIDDVQYPVAMHAAFGGDSEGTIRSLNDTEDGLMIGAYQRNLDKLSLKARTLEILLEIDRERAKQIVFQMGGQLGLKPRTCEDVLAYMPDEIYPVIGKVAKAVFNEKQVAEGQRALFVSPWLENIESPRQIYPALGLLNEMQGSAAERQVLFSAMSRSIDRRFNDDRSFTQTWGGLAARIGRITSGESDPLKMDLRNSFRSMAAKNLTGNRCKDNEIKRGQPLPGYIDAINKLFPDKPFTLEDFADVEYSGTANPTHILKKSSMAAKFRDELIATRGQKIVDNKVVNHDVNDVEWASRVGELVDRMLAYEGTDGETEGELLFLKAAFVDGMVSGIEKGELRKALVRKFMRLVIGSRLQKTSFIRWRSWIASVERNDPDIFDDLAAEFPNPNLKVIVAVKKMMEAQKKAEPPPAKTEPAVPAKEIVP